MTDDERDEYTRTRASSTTASREDAQHRSPGSRGPTRSLAGPIQCIVCPGNDDHHDLDELPRHVHRDQVGEGNVIDLPDGYQLASSGWTNLTPWDTAREEDEPKPSDAFPGDRRAGHRSARAPRARSARAALRHPLDVAPKIDWETLTVQGQDQPMWAPPPLSEVIEEVQPILSLHGHIHEVAPPCVSGAPSRSTPEAPTSKACSPLRRGARRKEQGEALPADQRVSSYRVCTECRGGAFRRSPTGPVGGRANGDTTSQPGEQTLFVRKASGLIKGWSTTDGFQLRVLLHQPLPRDLWLPLRLLLRRWQRLLVDHHHDVFVLPDVLVYAGFIAAMPRAGGDYVWQSRVFHSPIGFVLGGRAGGSSSGCGFRSTPPRCVNSVHQSDPRILGGNGSADWLASKNGVFVASLAIIALATYSSPSA